MKIVLFIGFATVLYIIYKRSIKRIDSDLASAPIDYTSRGLHKFKQRNYQGALDDYTKAIQNNPKNWIAYNNRGNTYSVMHHDAQTNEEKLRLIELATNDFNASLKIKSYNEGNHKAYKSLRELSNDLEYIQSNAKSEKIKAKEMMDSSKNDIKNIPIINEYQSIVNLKLSNHLMSTEGVLRRKDFGILHGELAEELDLPSLSASQKDDLIEFMIKEAMDELIEVFPLEITFLEEKKDDYQDMVDNANVRNSYQKAINDIEFMSKYSTMAKLLLSNHLHSTKGVLRQDEFLRLHDSFVEQIKYPMLSYDDKVVIAGSILKLVMPEVQEVLPFSVKLVN